MVKLNKYGYYELINKPSEKELEDYYAEKYYQEGTISTYRHAYPENELMYFNNKIEQKYNYLISKDVIESSRKYNLLDVGCGEGFTMNYFKELGWDVTGLDFSSFGCQSFHPNCMENFIEGDVSNSINKLISEKKMYDVVWLDNVLEHVLDPSALLKQLFTITTAGGLLIIEVPNDFSIAQTYLLENGILNEQNWVFIPDHISYFNKQGLERLCDSEYWNTIGTLSDFPIDWFLFNHDSNYYKDRSKGKSAHRARVLIENLLHENSTGEVNQLYEAFANVGMGRQIIGFFQKS